ncbi:MAG: hypothetical protein DRN29_09505 [Thermoplasmata archaeon]|nr:MAG: hypothetical protein DRN29_09505 [Thermoplasmata archaeon]
MVKDKVGRQRYILFSVDGDASRIEIIRALNASYQKKFDDENVPWLTVYTGKYGIVRCGHLQKEEIIDLLNSLQNEKFRLKTLKTSGTIKKLKKEINSF